MATSEQQTNSIGLAVTLVSAYVRNHTVTPEELPRLIGQVHAALEQLNGSIAPSFAASNSGIPAVPIKKSITADYIICLEDGKKFKSLRRHLNTHYKLSPEAYRAKWGLPPDYPMVAPNYADKRSQLAKTMGLGQKSNKKRRSKASKG